MLGLPVEPLAPGRPLFYALFSGFPAGVAPGTPVFSLMPIRIRWLDVVRS